MPTLSLAIDARGMKQGAAVAAQANERVQKTSNQAAKGMDRLDKSMKSAGATAGRIGKTLSGLFAGLSAVVTIRQAIKTIADFELTMKTVAGVTRATAEDFALLNSTARELGATTKFTATEAGEGLLFLARAGFDTSQSVAAVGATLKLAQVGLLELGESADIASNIVKGFRLEAEETNRVAEGLVIVSNRSNTSVRQLAEAMKFVAPVAAALGVSFEETAAGVGALGDAGIQASLAGTNLRGIFSALLGPTAKAKKAFEELGIAERDIDPERVGLIGAFKAFRDANLGAAEAVAIFGRRNAAAALVLSQATDTMEDLNRATKDAKGELNALAAVMDDSLIGAFKSLISAIQESFLQLGDAGLGGAMKSLVQTTTSVVRVFIGMASEAETADKTVQSLVRAVNALVAGTAAWLALQLPKAIAATTLAVKALTFAMLKNPFILIATGVAGITAAFLDLGVSFKNFSNKAFIAIDVVRAVISILVEDITFAINKVKNWAKSWAELSAEGLKALGVSEKLVQSFKDFSAAEALNLDFSQGPHAQLIEDIRMRVEGYQRERDAIRDAVQAAKDKAEQDRLAAEAAQAAVDAVGNGNEVLKERSKLFQELLDPLREERKLLGLSNDQREQKLALMEATALFAEGENIGLADFAQLEQLIATNQALRRLEHSARDVGDAVADGMLAIASGAKSAREAVESLANEIFRLILRQTVAQPISNLVSGALFSAFSPTLTPSAQGNVFSGPVTPFARGGVVSSPIAFPMNGGVGLAGEAGPEAILPLGRDREGNLGVRGGNTVNVYINTPDANSFRKSRRQVANDISRMVN